MSDLIAVAYRDMHKAAEVLATMRRLQGEYLIDLEDAAYVTKDRDSKIRLHQSVNIPLIGAMTGTFWGMLVGLLFLNPLLGAALGAGGGALSGTLMDYGINDEFMQKLGRELTPGSSAIFILARHYTPDKVIEELARYGGTILRSSLTREAEQRMQEALSGVQPSAATANQSEPTGRRETGTPPQPHSPS